MHLNKLHSIFHNLMTQDIRIQHVIIYQRALDAHGKQTVRVSSKRLAVKEISPPADDLPRNQSQHACIRHREKGYFFYTGINDHRDGSRDHTAINGKPAGAQVKNLKQIFLIIIPLKNHIINSCTDNGTYDCVQCKIQIKFRILPSPLCI